VPSRLTEVIVDAHDLERLADFWCAALGYVRRHHGEGWLLVGPPGEETTTAAWVAAPQPTCISFVSVPESKTQKNRVHLDITPVGGSTQADEVERLLLLGATRADLGQDATAWVVLRDPEGNEFCVMPEVTDD
jgi:hypothetical protein